MTKKLLGLGLGDFEPAYRIVAGGGLATQYYGSGMDKQGLKEFFSRYKMRHFQSKFSLNICE